MCFFSLRHTDRRKTRDRCEGRLFSFIGSSKVGWLIRAPGTRCTLEHGGAAPVIVDESADLDAMLPFLVKGAYYHAGQVCVSVQRIYVPRALAQSVAKNLADSGSQLVVGNAVEQTTEVGPLIRPREVQRVADCVEETASEGGRILCGGKSVRETAYLPTVVLDPPRHVRLSSAEIFGPVVAVFAYDDLDDAIAMADALPFAFQASGFTRLLDVVTKLIQSFDATAVIINDHTAFRVDWMPFAGRRGSGYGTGGIGYTMHYMTQDKMAANKF